MKVKLILVMLLLSNIMYSQKTKNGTVYKEHPAIEAIESMLQAFYAGDEDKVATYLTDDFKSYNGTSTNKNAKGRDKEWFLGGVEWTKENMAYTSYTRSPGTYPDAIEYEEDDELWVQTWDQFKAIDNKTGVKIEMPMHRLYKMTSDNKIMTMITYNNALPWAERRNSFAPRSNGTIYKNHDYINTVRLMMGALEHSDVDKAFSYFTEDATFTNLDMARGESRTIEEEKEMYTGLVAEWTIESIDVVGYPDYLEYEIGNSKIVQSWWDARMTRKSDGKEVILPMLFMHRFNDDGMIIRETGYFTTRSME